MSPRWASSRIPKAHRAELWPSLVFPELGKRRRVLPEKVVRHSCALGIQAGATKSWLRVSSLGYVSGPAPSMAMPKVSQSRCRSKRA